MHPNRWAESEAVLARTDRVWRSAVSRLYGPEGGLRFGYGPEGCGETVRAAIMLGEPTWDTVEDADPRIRSPIQAGCN